MEHMVDQLRAARWSPAQAATWADRCAGLRGCNYIPRHCVNTTAMWQELDGRVVDQELGWAAEIGLNSLRVFVQYLVYESNPRGLLDDLSRFLDIAHRHRLSVMFVLFDDCFGPEPQLGPQPAPRPGVHNSGWTASPGVTRREPQHWPALTRYVAAILDRFKFDERIIAWDLYNEAQPSSRPLVEAAFSWARDVGPIQPITSCWQADDLSDIVTFHCYLDPRKLEFDATVKAALASGRPAVCTECMARTPGSTLERFIPPFSAAQIGWYVWGLVSGATQTRFPWGWPAGGPEPYIWHHDLLYPDGSPYREEEIARIRACSPVGGGIR